ncbi:MAG: protein kinase [Nannocystaceae bacterium]|nr:protein kinase [Nannocystaceae bacterium]
MDACPDTDAILAFAEGQTDAAARERVAAHVDDCADCAALVREALAARETSPGEPVHESPVDGLHLVRGMSLGRYIVLDSVGRGGLGEVYAAYDPELDRRVAIKLLMRGRGNGEGFERRLVREGRALAKVTHPNVVAVYDVGTLGERVFIAMELVHGVTLGAWLAAAPRTWQQVRDVMLGAAAGLHAAHQCGLVHRDFKPSNVIVERDVRAKVLDFGLARAALEPSGDARALVGDASPTSTVTEQPLTQTGAVLGTPAYMAPEQMVAAAVDARADQFAFCVACYEALLGCRPFAGRTLAELHAAITRGVPAEPSVERRVPAWLRRAIVQGLALDPAQRHPSMAALAQAMTADPRARRRPWLALAAAAIVVAGGATWAARGPVEAAATADDDTVTALTHDARAAAAKSYFVYPPPDDPEYRTANRVLLQLEAMTDTAAAAQALALRREFAETLVRLGDHFWDREGGTPFALDYYAQALVFDPEATQARERAMMTPGELASLRRKADDLSFTPAELAAAEPLAVLAAPDEQERRRRLDALYQRDRAPSLSTTARLEGVLGEEVTQVVRRTATRPRRAAEPRVATAPAAVPSEPELPVPIAAPPKPSAPRYDTAAEYREAGRAALQAGRFGEAETLLGRALQLDRKDAEAAHALAELHFERGALDRAIEFARRAVAARPKVARHHLLLGDCLRKAGRVDEARAQYESARALGNATAEARLAKLETAGDP